MTNKIMFEVEVMRSHGGEVIAIVHGALKGVARDQLWRAASGFGAMLDAGLRVRIWIDAENGSIRMNPINGSERN